MYPQIIEQESQLFRALAHPKRLEIMSVLHDRELCVGDIVKKVHLPQSNVSQHLMILRKAHLLCTKKVGQKMYYHILSPRLLTLTDMMMKGTIGQ